SFVRQVPTKEGRDGTGWALIVAAHSPRKKEHRATNWNGARIARPTFPVSTLFRGNLSLPERQARREGKQTPLKPGAFLKEKGCRTLSSSIGHSLTEQAQHRLGLHEFARLIEVIVSDRVRIDAQHVIHRRQNLHRM